MSRAVRSRWVLPIDRPPIRDGWIQYDTGRITAVGAGRAPVGAEDLGSVAILPGLVNAHTHLELSWMAGRVPPSGSMDEWIGTIVRLRRAGVPGGPAAELDAARGGIAAARAAGTVLMGDISNNLCTPALLADAGLGGVVFHELIGFRTPNPTGAVRDAWARADDVDAMLARRGCRDVSVSVVAHAPYSVSPALFAAILQHVDSSILSIHLAESAEELEFLRTGLGPIRRALEELGAWTPDWPVPACDPVEYLAKLGYLRRGLLVVHGVHLTLPAIERLRDAGATIVTCPRSNGWVGGGMPPVSHFYASGVPVAIGTDSLASVGTLSVFDELAELRRIAPEVSAASLLESATRVGAEALGRGATFGTITPGKRPALVTVRVPESVTDVEEYLVGGIAPADIGLLSPA